MQASSSYVRPILLFLFYSYVKCRLDNDSCLPIYKMIPAICNTPRQTNSVRNYIFPHFVMVITALWAELWVVVVRCNLTESVGIVHILIHINLGYFRYIEQEREDILVSSTVYSMVDSLKNVTFGRTFGRAQKTG